MKKHPESCLCDLSQTFRFKALLQPLFLSLLHSELIFMCFGALFIYLFAFSVSLSEVIRPYQPISVDTTLHWKKALTQCNSAKVAKAFIKHTCKKQKRVNDPCWVSGGRLCIVMNKKKSLPADFGSWLESTYIPHLTFLLHRKPTS